MSKRVRRTRRNSSQIKAAEYERHVSVQTGQHSNVRVPARPDRVAKGTSPPRHEFQILSHVAGNRAVSLWIQRHTPDSAGGPDYSTDLSSIASAAQLSALDEEAGRA